MTEGSWSPGSPTVDLLMRVSEAFTSGEDQRWLALHHPDCEFDLSRYDHWGGDAVYRGREGIERFRRDWAATFEDESSDLDQLIELRDGRFLLIVTRRARRKADDEPLEETVGMVGQAEGGLVKHLKTYSDRQEAMRDAGLA